MGTSLCVCFDFEEDTDHIPVLSTLCFELKGIPSLKLSFAHYMTLQASFRSQNAGLEFYKSSFSKLLSVHLKSLLNKLF